MSIEKYVEQDFQALETSFSKGEPLSDVALPRILENISKLDDADRIFHWHEELRRIGGLLSDSVIALGDPIVIPVDLPFVAGGRPDISEPSVQDTAVDTGIFPALEDASDTGGDGSLSK